MKITPCVNINPSFKSASVSINALSDTHGELLLANSAIEEMRQRQNDIFYPQGRGNANIIAVCGDWFMDGAKKGFVSNPEKTRSKFQLDILNEFYNQVKSIAANTTSIFTLGNHEFDGGVSLLDEVLSKLNADIIATNLDIDQSAGFSKTIADNKIFKQKIIEVDDDKNPNLKHKILILAIMPVNLKMYQSNLNGINLTDLNDKALAFVDKEDYQQTLDECKKRIASFKEENPNGITVFLCHAGADFSDNLAREASVDIIFDAHEHKTKKRIVNSTPIIPLSQNFLKIATAKLQIDDKGKLSQITINSFNPSENKTQGPLYRLYNALFKEDIKKQYAIRSKNPDITMLDIKGVREGNSFLANFITDSVLFELRKQEPDVNIFALNASAITHSLDLSDKPSTSSFDIMNVLTGIKEQDGNIMVSKITGEQLAYLVRDNVDFNSIDAQKNPIIHYSGLIFDRNEILKAIQEGKSLKYITQFIIDTKTNTPIDPNKTYKIANVEKYFNKSRDFYIKGLKKSSKDTGLNVHQLFKQHFESEKENLYAECDIRIK